MQCTAIKKDGIQCRALAMRNDPDQRCGFHSKRNSFAVQRAAEFTKAEAIKIIGQEIRVLRKSKGANPVDKAEALKDLILLWQSLTAPEPTPKPLTWAERAKLFEGERPTKPAR